MTDRQPTPREEAALRRLLRDARHDGPVPPEVTARTEETLAALRAGEQPGGQPGGLPVERPVPTGPGRPPDQRGRGDVDHHHPRRRRTASAMLVAAVSVVVVGIGLGQVLRPAADQESSTAASGSGEVARDTPPDRAAPVEEQEAGDSSALQDRPPGSRFSVRRGVPVERLALVGEPPVVSEARFARDVTRVRRLQLAERSARTTTSAGRTVLAARDPAPGFTCTRTAWGAGRAVAVRYDQAPAVLVLRPPTRATQVADLLECGSGDVVRSLTLAR